MPAVTYVPKKFSAEHSRIIASANAIIASYQAQGFQLTLRQLYYQFVARDLIPNRVEEYKRLGNIVNDARLAGEIDWNAIEDRTRNIVELSKWSGPDSILRAVAQQFHHNWWEGQSSRVEVWVEKEALAGIIGQAANSRDVTYFACRGYVSQSEMWAAGQRLIHYQLEGLQPVILHLGDHDPSGMDMSRDIQDRLRLFGARPKFRRLALNFDQIQEFNPPPNPAKTTDARYAGYEVEFGDESWEPDALEPAELVRLITEAIDEEIDDRYAFSLRQEEEGLRRDELALIADNYSAVAEFCEAEFGQDGEQGGQA